MKKAHKANNKITAKLVRTLLEYNQETGQFIWKPRKEGWSGFNTRFANKKAGCKDGRGIIIGIGDFHYQAHRLGWLISYGRWPNKDVDHIDGNPMNNQLSNLRLATPSENLRNRGKQKNNKSGYKGVFFNTQKKKWQAKICKNRVQFNLGFFPNPLDAHNAYVTASEEVHGRFARIA